MQAQRQSLVQQQQLRMNPQLLQSIKLMELPIMDLRERIGQELENNPALEIIADYSTVPIDESETQQKDEQFDKPLDDEDDALRSHLSAEEEYEYFETTSDPGRWGSELSEEHRRFLEGVLTRPETLQEHLLRQLQLEPIDEELRTIAETLIQNLDDDGFHKEKPEALFKTAQPRLAEAIKIVQALEPAGTCTADFHESLMVQITLLQHASSVAHTASAAHVASAAQVPDEILTGIKKALENLDLIEREKYSALAKKINLDEEDTQFICDYIKKLSPFPGRAFESKSGEVRYVVPDIRVVRDGDELSINLNDEVFPVLGTSIFFEELCKSRNQQAKEFAREKIREARLFINHLSQRNKTLIRVANAVLEFQKSFFINGPKYLAPLTLGDIARELKIHETTVSRTANGKYMQTEWGIFEIRHFFTNSVSGINPEGSHYSKESVKEIIREILAAENRLLSDKDISVLLHKKGIALARRTVAKYRKELDMGSSYTRKVRHSLTAE